MAQRSSTRLHHAPGGQSTMGSLIFGGGDNSAEEDRPRGRGVRKFETPEQIQAGKDQQSNQRYGQQQQQQQPTAESQNVSSNRYASGTSQNTGNVITDRSTTRIHAPPGGVSTIGQSNDQRGSSNRFASGSSQNTGNVITDRSTTRIHAPPGGASSFRLG